MSDTQGYQSSSQVAPYFPQAEVRETFLSVGTRVAQLGSLETQIQQYFVISELKAHYTHIYIL